MDLRSDLRSYSAKWGKDFLLVQGAGGNTSVKDDGRLIIKASGRRLADAGRRQIFVDIALADGVAMAGGGAAPAATDGMRASIETSLHAVMPHTVVAHLHMVPLMAHAVRGDAEQTLRPVLDGLNWAFIPYAKPGVAVAGQAMALLRDGRPDIIVLGNHGVVVAGDDCAEVDARIADLMRRTEVPIADAPAVDPAGLADAATHFGLEIASLPAAHRLALAPSQLAAAVSGSLYPDHVVFLGRAAAIIGRDPSAETSLFLVAGTGALLRAGLAHEAHEMAACLAEVLARVPDGAPLRTLTRAEEDDLIDWDAEHYRRTLAETGR